MNAIDKCGEFDWVNDGFCDDMNNNEACNYDGGDCCGTLADKRFCLQCQCICKSIKKLRIVTIDNKNPY